MVRATRGRSTTQQETSEVGEGQRLSPVRTTLLVATAAVMLAMSGEPVKAQPSSGGLDITAFAVNMSNIGTGANAVVEIRIDSWSTPEERRHFVSTAIEKKEKALLSELQKAKVRGRFHIPGLMGPDPHQLRLGHDIRFAWQETLVLENYSSEPVRLQSVKVKPRGR